MLRVFKCILTRGAAPAIVGGDLQLFFYFFYFLTKGDYMVTLASGILSAERVFHKVVRQLAANMQGRRISCIFPYLPNLPE